MTKASILMKGTSRTNPVVNTCSRVLTVLFMERNPHDNIANAKITIVIINRIKQPEESFALPDFTGGITGRAVDVTGGITGRAVDIPDAFEWNTTVT
jgi:hypothetical protein